MAESATALASSQHCLLLATGSSPSHTHTLHIYHAELSHTLSPVAINQQVVRFEAGPCQPLHSSPHCQHGGLQDVDAVNGAVVDQRTAGQDLHTCTQAHNAAQPQKSSTYQLQLLRLTSVPLRKLIPPLLHTRAAQISCSSCILTSVSWSNLIFPSYTHEQHMLSMVQVGVTCESGQYLGNRFQLYYCDVQPSTAWKGSAQAILHGQYYMDGTHTAYDTSGCVVSCSNTASLSASLICLLSFRSSNSRPGGSTAAAATTGPASGPLPASSTPATAW